MINNLSVTTLFVDVGGVLLANGWDRYARKRPAERFDPDPRQMDERHHLTCDSYEVGKISLAQYLDRVVFFKQRPLAREQFRRFMFAQSESFPQMIELTRALKSRYRLKIVVISNQGRALTEHRIHKFARNTFVHFFISSCFVHFRKPDEDIFCLALDTAQVPAEKLVYIDDRALFVQAAESLGIRGIHYRDYQFTCGRLADLGLEAGQ